MRVLTLARELGVPYKVLLNYIQNVLGQKDIKRASSKLEPTLVETIRHRWNGKD